MTVAPEDQSDHNEALARPGDMKWDLRSSCGRQVDSVKDFTIRLCLAELVAFQALSLKPFPDFLGRSASGSIDPLKRQSSPSDLP